MHDFLVRDKNGFQKRKEGKSHNLQINYLQSHIKYLKHLIVMHLLKFGQFF